MPRPEEISRRLSDEEDNCDVEVTSAATGKVSPGTAFIPVFAGAAIIAGFGAGTPVHQGDEIRRLSDSRRFRVAQLLRAARDGRLRVELQAF
jgi:hypothetical protein